MIDLKTNYLGFRLKSPIVASSSPMTKELANFRRLEDCGAAAIVMHSLFEEQIHLESLELDRSLVSGANLSAEAYAMFPDMSAYNIGPDAYLELIGKAKGTVGVPVIASLNGFSTGGWIRYAKLIEEAGADAIELNIYSLPSHPEISGSEIEYGYYELVRTVKRAVSIPVAVKLGPFFSAMAHVAKQLDEAGANALVLFNRFYQPDFDLEKLEVVPSLNLSHPNELRLRIHWTAILSGKVSADIAITGGVHSAEDIIKCMMSGAKIAMTTSALLAHGIEHLEVLNVRLRDWMEVHQYESISQMQGSMKQESVPSPATFDRGNYMRVLSSYAARAY